MIEPPAVASGPQTSPRRRIPSVGLIVAGDAMILTVAVQMREPKARRLTANATTDEVIPGGTQRVWAVPAVRGSGADTRI